MYSRFLFFFFKVSYPLFSQRKYLFTDEFLQEATQLCVSEPSVQYY